MKRKLGISEKVVWLLGQVGSNNIVIITEISGSLPEEVLREALVLIQKKHSLLNVHIELTKNIPIFVTGTQKIPLRIVELNSPEQWIQETNDEMNLPFSWEKGPLVRVVWLRSEKVHILLITLHHVISDGKSGVYLVRDLLSITAELLSRGVIKSHIPLPERPSIDEIIPASFSGFKGVLGMLKTGLRQNLMLAKQPQTFAIEKDVPLQQIRRCVIHRILSEETTRLLTVRCRQEKTSVHAILCAIMMKASAQKINKQKIVRLCCLSAINLRHLLTPPIKDEIGFYASVLSTFHQLGVETSPWNLAREVKTNLSNLLEQGQVLATLMLQKNILSFRCPSPIKMAQEVNQVFRATTGVSNLGLIEIPENYGSLVIRKLHFCVSGNAFPQKNIGIAVTTFRGQMVLNFLFSVPHISLNNAENFVNYAIETLEQALELPKDNYYQITLT
ncbi:hypothetical protein B4U84_26520 [Westiellopsis prolifica IICB1]|nr:hypothetical protein B4U84_26520 [Westiellopsis prolifica IICB1]